MNKIGLTFLIPLYFSACIGKHTSEAPKASITAARPPVTMKHTGDTLKIDTKKSELHWKGTKMRGAGKHEGDISLQSGYFISENQQLIGGKFIVDMTSIEVTDIPDHEPIPRNNLNNHLKSEDFFHVEKFPTARLLITHIKPLQGDSLLVAGNLTIKDITKNIEFGATYSNASFVTRFTIDRFLWNVAYRGNLADKTLVDKDIELTINLQLKN